MASPVSTKNLKIVEVHSHIRGYHAYWDPQLLGLLRMEPGNPCNEHVVETELKKLAIENLRAVSHCLFLKKFNYTVISRECGIVSVYAL